MFGLLIPRHNDSLRISCKSFPSVVLFRSHNVCTPILHFIVVVSSSSTFMHAFLHCRSRVIHTHARLVRYCSEFCAPSISCSRWILLHFSPFLFQIHRDLVWYSSVCFEHSSVLYCWLGIFQSNWFWQKVALNLLGSYVEDVSVIRIDLDYDMVVSHVNMLASRKKGFASFLAAHYVVPESSWKSFIDFCWMSNSVHHCWSQDIHLLSIDIATYSFHVEPNDRLFCRLLVS